LVNWVDALKPVNAKTVALLRRAGEEKAAREANAADIAELEAELELLQKNRVTTEAVSGARARARARAAAKTLGSRVEPETEWGETGAAPVVEEASRSRGAAADAPPAGDDSDGADAASEEEDDEEEAPDAAAPPDAELQKLATDKVAKLQGQMAAQLELVARTRAREAKQLDVAAGFARKLKAAEEKAEQNEAQQQGGAGVFGGLLCAKCSQRTPAMFCSRSACTSSCCRLLGKKAGVLACTLHR
jgi:hypothetical protein